ncbi:hypothetical protein HUK80_06235 [Flavobacterium sp. MAH-1]|uniref:Uncharacterized protein n=1 Tax=Flavobacterium agri TaxID=2743471 RepID=A0A7Y8Y120_9FLAO|nr:hypothetical protein [Flavobacterium agri]NUY80487.1 hypothetical protein [Flavobacterium agri]NYA70512.1 hypothetical protein [Flavobacterium agri]
MKNDYHIFKAWTTTLVVVPIAFALFEGDTSAFAIGPLFQLFLFYLLCEFLFLLPAVMAMAVAFPLLRKYDAGRNVQMMCLSAIFCVTACLTFYISEAYGYGFKKTVWLVLNLLFFLVGGFLYNRTWRRK